MSSRSSHPDVCPGKSGAVVDTLSARHGQRRTWPRWLFPLAGLLALAWFLVRVGPKPARAAYPCQRVALPLASSFVLWLAALVGSFVLFQRARRWLRRAAFEKACLGALLAGAILFIGVGAWPGALGRARPAARHDPLGVARGIFPGRVVWVHSPDATRWQGTNFEGGDIGDGYWWQSNHTSQAAVDDMLARAIGGLTGESDLAAAWDALFRSFNIDHGLGAVGYQPGQKIAMKMNMGIVNRVHGEFVDANGNQTMRQGWVTTSPQIALAVLRQLINATGVQQSDITIGDTTSHFPNHYWDICHSEFPGVHYLAFTDQWGRTAPVSSQGQPCESRIHWSGTGTEGTTPDYLPICFAEAAYIINIPCLRGHSSGVTLCGKNHYGSLTRLPDSPGYYNLHLSLPNRAWSPGMAHYRAHVDLLGQAQLGGKTVLNLIDGLYAGYWWEGHPYKWHIAPFGDGVRTDWPSSVFVSQDPVALDSVAFDFLQAEWPNIVSGGTGAPGGLEGGAEDYLHEAALADNPPSGTNYAPDGGGATLESLGAHEHWNDVVNKQYSRNLGTGNGIELVRVTVYPVGDLNCSLHIEFSDIDPFVLAIEGQAPYEARYPNCQWLNADCNRDGLVNFADIDPFVALLETGE